MSTNSVIIDPNYQAWFHTIDKAAWKTLQKVRENSRNGFVTVLRLDEAAALDLKGWIKQAPSGLGYKVTAAGRKALEAYKKEVQ